MTGLNDALDTQIEDVLTRLGSKSAAALGRILMIPPGPNSFAQGQLTRTDEGVTGTFADINGDPSIFIAPPASNVAFEITRAGIYSFTIGSASAIAGEGLPLVEGEYYDTIFYAYDGWPSPLLARFPAATAENVATGTLFQRIPTSIVRHVEAGTQFYASGNPTGGSMTAEIAIAPLIFTAG